MTTLSEPGEPTTRVVRSTIIRLVATVAILISGLVHLQLYFSGYRNIPDIGRSFLLQGFASIVVAGALVLRRDVVVRLIAAGLAASTLVALTLSRTDRGIFGFQERGLEPSPQTVITIVVEIVVIVAVAITFLPAVGPGESLQPRLAAAALLTMAVVSIGAIVIWAGSDGSDSTESATPTTPTTESVATSPQPADTTDGPARTVADTVEDPDTSTAPPPPASAAENDPTTTESDDDATVVSIVDFAFDEEELEIPVGTTVRWVNDDSFAHSVVADDDSFVSERLEPGDASEFTFETAGQFDYICGIHPSMTATISVVG